MMRGVDAHRQSGEGFSRRSDIIPLFLVPGLAALVACARQWPHLSAWNWTVCIQDFTGLLLIFLAAFRLCELRSFAEAFVAHDFLGKSFRFYAYLYPLLELGLGVGFLVGARLSIIAGTTVGLMTFTSWGIASALQNGIGEDSLTGAHLKVAPSVATVVAQMTVAALATLICWFVPT